MVLCGKKPLLYDEACLEVFNDANLTVSFSGQTSECYKCNYLFLGNVEKKHLIHFILPTNHPYLYEASSGNYNYCNGVNLFRQHGVYGLNITDVSCSNVFLITEPDNSFKPLSWELFILLAIVTLCALLAFARKSHWLKQLFRSAYAREMENDLGTPVSGDSAPLVQSEIAPIINRFRSRMKSLDTFRGLAICLMIFVNYGGGEYWFFHHAPWNGLTFADLVFPWFAWIMGVGIVMSIRSQLRDRVKRWQIFLRSLKRAASLIILGIILNSISTNNIYKLRIPGVLQRLGLAYFIVASIESLFMESQNSIQNYGRFMMFRDIISSWKQWLLIILVGIIHFTITMYFSTDSKCPVGYLGPGGLHEYGQYLNCTGGAAGFIDRQIFGINHLYRSTAKKIYHTSLPFDPEGLLGTLNTAVVVFMGVQAGRIILHYSDTSGKIKRWIFWAVITGLLGGQLCNWQQEGGFIPLNKNLWSLSYSLVVSSSAFMLLTILLVVIDHTKWWTGTPFQEAGKNSILIYVLSVLTKGMLPWTWDIVFDKSSHAEYLIMDTWGTFLWVFLAIILNKNEVYVTI